MQFITNRIHTGKAKRFEDFVKEYQDKEAKQIKVAAAEEVVKTAEEDEAPSSGQLDVEPLHQTGESTTMPKAGPSAKKEDGPAKSAGSSTKKEKDEADSSGQPEAEGKLTNDPKVPTKEEKGGGAKAEVKEAALTCEQCKKTCDECACKGCDCKPCSAARANAQIKEAKKPLPDALKEHQFKATEDKEETEDKEAEVKEEVKEAKAKEEEEEEKKEEKEAQCKKTEEEKKEGKEEKEEKEAQCKKTDEEEEEKKEDKEAVVDEKKFVKIANLDAKNKAFLKKYWKQLFGEDYANALIADK